MLLSKTAEFQRTFQSEFGDIVLQSIAVGANVGDKTVDLWAQYALLRRILIIKPLLPRSSLFRLGPESNVG